MQSDNVLLSLCSNGHVTMCMRDSFVKAVLGDKAVLGHTEPAWQ